MARHQVILCDVCGNPTDALAGKLIWTPNIPGVAHLNKNNYTHSAHVGMCCKEKIFGSVKFEQRMTKDEYAKKRKERAGKSTVRVRKTASNAA